MVSRRHHRRSRFGFVWSITSRSVALLVGSIVVGLVMWTLVPALFGYRPNLVNSNSMRPSVSEGDVVLTRPLDVERIRVGQVVLVEDASRDVPYLHRVRSVEDGAIVTKGDANPTSDFPTVRPDQIRGVGQILIPRVGWPVLWARNHPGLVPVVAGVALIAVAVPLLRPRRRHRGYSAMNASESITSNFS